MQFALLSAAVIALTHFIVRNDFISLFGLYSVGFIAYLQLNKLPVSWKQMLWAGIGLRLVALFSEPALSDDFYRFLWDGHVWTAGLNPYMYTPQALYGSSKLSGYSSEIYSLLNSSNYYTVYPPLNQYFFALPALLFGKNLLASTILLKASIFAAEVGTCLVFPKLLRVYELNIKQAGWYILNPLVIIELCGNSHFEGVMIFFLLLGLYFLKTQKWILAGICFSLAVNMKLVPLIFLPFLIKYMGFKKSAISMLIGILITALLALPFISKELVSNILSSVGLYFQGFAFNSFFYSILFDISPDDWKAKVATSLLLIPATFIVYHFFKTSIHAKNLVRYLILTLGIYFLFSAVMHPWYLCTLLALSTLNHQRWVITWTWVVFLSYFTYRVVPYEESPFMIALAYFILFTVMAFDYMSYKRNQNRLKQSEA
ncbi:MAG: hypothetical protein KDC83_05260 [Flavobacteriales bacterium]|nr:hypothetical protein [Flavobacteriales bacterium]